MAEVEFFGESFAIAAEPNEFALMEFAETSEQVEDDSMAAMAAIYRLLREAIVPEDWKRFQASARKNRANSESLMPVIFSVFEQVVERPTGLPADSSDGQEVTPLRSVSQPDDPAMARFAGRPDLQAALMRTRGLVSA